MKTLLLSSLVAVVMPAAMATEVTVSYSEDFAETLADDYGEREGERLSERITSDLAKAFEKKGIDPARVEVTILDAKPNKPTFQQLSDNVSLDFSRSISIGGMDLVGTAYDADGNELGTQAYDWFETDITHVLGLGVWSDAQRTSRRFATRFANTLSGE